MDNQKPTILKSDAELGFTDITVHEAKGLQKMDARGLSDPYVVVALEHKDGQVVAKKQTKFIKQNLQPVWNQGFSFNVKNEEQIFHFSVWDHNYLGSHRHMGQFMVMVGQIMQDDWSDWFKLKSKDGDEVIGEDGTESTVRVTLRFTPHASKEMMSMSKSIYDPDANEDDLKLAIRAAAGTYPKKRVLLQLGSDWSIACKKLFFMLLDNKSCKPCLEQYYEYVLLDAEREHNVPVLKKLGDPQHLGFPVLVILDSQGRYIHQQATSALERDPTISSNSGPDPAKILRFLLHWREDGPADKELGKLREDDGW